MQQYELDAVLEKHKKWLNGDEDGERADLRGADFRCADLRDANLRCADLSDADLSGADFRCADFRCADLSGANLRDANLSGADLRGADFRCADLSGANLRDANLRCADVDYSCWTLWCGSLKVYICDRIAKQLLYHVVSVIWYSKHVSDRVKKIVLTKPIIDLANEFHRVDECGKIKYWEENTEHETEE